MRGEVRGARSVAVGQGPPYAAVPRHRRRHYLKYAQLQYDLIARFGRFPHRNEAMGRISTQEERDYLASGGFSG